MRALRGDVTWLVEGQELEPVPVAVVGFQELADAVEVAGIHVFGDPGQERSDDMVDANLFGREWHEDCNKEPGQ